MKGVFILLKSFKFIKLSNLKYLTIGIIIGSLLSVSIAQATNPIKLIVNGVDITYKSDVPPQIINGRTLVPARALAESLGASVEWDGENKVVRITSRQQGNVTTPPVNTVDGIPTVTPVKDNPKPPVDITLINQVETLKDYYIQGDVSCIKYNGTVYVPLLVGINYYNLFTNESDFIYNPNNKSITFKNINKTYIAGNIENNDDYIYYQGRTYIKEDILKTMSN